MLPLPTRIAAAAGAAAQEAERQPDGEGQGPPRKEDGVDDQAREQEEGEALPPPPVKVSVLCGGRDKSFGRLVGRSVVQPITTIYNTHDRYIYPGTNPNHSHPPPPTHKYITFHVHPDDVAVGPRGAGVHPKSQVLVGVREDSQGLAERDEDLRQEAGGLLGAWFLGWFGVCCVSDGRLWSNVPYLPTHIIHNIHPHTHTNQHPNTHAPGRPNWRLASAASACRAWRSGSRACV